MDEQLEEKVPYQIGMILDVRKTLDSHLSLSAGFERIELLILQILNAERLSIFQRKKDQNELIAQLKTGYETKEIRLPMNLHSIAGYVSVSQKSIIVANPYDTELLTSIHPQLEFNRSFDEQANFRTQNVLCVPIVHAGVLLGVLEVINSDVGFSKSDLALATDIAKLLGLKYHTEIGGTREPLEYLVKTGALSYSDLTHAKSRFPVFSELLDHLQEIGISLDEIGASFSMFYQVPFIAYKPEQYFVSDLQSKLNESYARRNQVVIIKDGNHNNIVLLAKPNNSELLLEIQTVLGIDECDIAVGLPSDIHAYLSLKPSVVKAKPKLANQQGKRSLLGSRNKRDNNGKVVPDHIRFVAELLTDAYNNGASDIHIEPDSEGSTLIRYRVDGDCRDVNRIMKDQHDGVVARIKILANLNVAEKRLPQDGKLAFALNEGKKLEVRVATVPAVDGEAVVMRLLSNASAMSFDELDLAPNVVNRLNNIIHKPHGIFLVVGPTGSGKTTTLHSILNVLNDAEKSIWAAEDPVEINQPRIQQVQINHKIGFTFSAALRAFLRADPDIILIGEMRDQETAQASIEASNTGHLVLSTLHTNSATESITRLLDMGIDPVNFSDSCLGILAQRLIKTLCSQCKHKVPLTDEKRQILEEWYGAESAHELSLREETWVYEAVGCEKCGGTGYKGRMGIHELLVMTDELRKLIIAKAPLSDMVAQAQSDGLRFFGARCVGKTARW